MTIEELERDFLQFSDGILFFLNISGPSLKVLVIFYVSIKYWMPEIFF